LIVLKWYKNIICSSYVIRQSSEEDPKPAILSHAAGASLYFRSEIKYISPSSHIYFRSSQEMANAFVRSMNDDLVNFKFSSIFSKNFFFRELILAEFIPMEK
jgi:hypothetical protein